VQEKVEQNQKVFVNIKVEGLATWYSTA